MLAAPNVLLMIIVLLVRQEAHFVMEIINVLVIVIVLVTVFTFGLVPPAAFVPFVQMAVRMDTVEPHLLILVKV